MPQPEIESVLTERRVFKPKAAFARAAHIKNAKEYDKLAKQAEKNPEKFWGDLAKELFWFKKWKKVLQWKAPHSKWFVGGKINISYNYNIIFCYCRAFFNFFGVT